jgi:hypothetical protein
MDIELPQLKTESKVCSETRKEDFEKRKKAGEYKQKNPADPFIQGQKYYVLDENVPNCVNSVVCNQTFEIGRKHSSLGKDISGNDNRFLKDTCFSYDAKYNTGNEIKQLDTLVDAYDENGEFNKFTTQISNKKYKYKLETPNKNDKIYYRKCSMFGCNSGTSLIDISGGRRKTRKNRRKNRKSRNRK